MLDTRGMNRSIGLLAALWMVIPGVGLGCKGPVEKTPPPGKEAQAKTKAAGEEAPDKAVATGKSATEEPRVQKKEHPVGKVDVAEAKEVFSNLKALSQKGEASAIAPFLFDRRARAFVTRLKGPSLQSLFAGKIEGHEVNGGRVLLHLSGNNQYKMAALFLTDTGFKYDPLVSRGYKPPDAGPDYPLNKPLTLEEATAGVEGTGELTATFETSMGNITCRLFDKKVPLTVANFVGLARGIRGFTDQNDGKWVKRPFYDGLIFHRVIPRFMIQGGCPSGTGQGGPGYKFADEFDLSLRHDGPGLLSMANSGPNTNGSQFFITEVPTPWLDDHHSIFGQCSPEALVKEITHVPATNARPKDPISIRTVRISRKAAQD